MSETLPPEGVVPTPRLSRQAAAAATAPVVCPVTLVLLDFASGPMRLWTGLGQIAWAGEIWEGAGALGAIGEIEETTEIRAVSLTLSLSPVPQAVVDIALAEQSYRLRRAEVWGALLNDQGAFVADPFPLWAGHMDTMRVVDGAESSVSINCESRFIDLERAEVRRYTDADQQAEYPGDRFFEFVPALVDAQISLPAS
ncbi:hypothetical protein NON00_24425 [Roseomonas sp. GC11]|uniref:hypothetical protein n=1 Tax=Roseomonas sp. GC11 TaxID=2950546 RepID=UPI00210D24F3|nr:hypothetical protein [Roseomonas sp. GC11]MCQ4163046.1 hypothetical protein [Roseomonas sp. GC11]